MRGVQRVPYRLNEWINEPGPIYVVEGEKDADRLMQLDVLATTQCGRRRKVVEHLRALLSSTATSSSCPTTMRPAGITPAQVAATCGRSPRSVRFVELPGLPDKGDISDWIGAGHTTGEVVAGLPPGRCSPEAKAEDAWTPPGIERLIEQATPILARRSSRRRSTSLPPCGPATRRPMSGPAPG